MAETSDTQQKPLAATQELATGRANFLMAQEKCEEAVRLCTDAQAEGAEPRPKMAEAQRACEEAVRLCEEAMPLCEAFPKRLNEAKGREYSCITVLIISIVLSFLFFRSCIDMVFNCYRGWHGNVPWENITTLHRGCLHSAV